MLNINQFHTSTIGLKGRTAFANAFSNFFPIY